MNKIYFILIVVNCVLTVFIHETEGDCLFPKKTLRYGKIIYKNKNDSKLKSAPENYLLQFKCLKGYTLEGQENLLCTSNKWTNTFPKCIKMTCLDPPAIPDGGYILDTGEDESPGIGSIATYFCKQGYKLENLATSTLTCSFSEENNFLIWKGDIPKCEEKVSCSDPGVSIDGKRNGDTLFAGDSVSYACNDEFELVGNETIYCLESGKWSSPRPLCRPFDEYCDYPPHIMHGVAKGDKKGDFYRTDDEVEIICKPGYYYNGSSIFIICEEEGQWDDDFKECVEITCGTPDSLENGTIPEIEGLNTTSFPYNFQLTYICDKGFRLIGDSWRLCEKAGWSGKPPNCEVIQCPDPGVPDYSTRTLDGMHINDKVTYECFSGYELIGSFERYCLPNGKWSGDLTKCNHKDNYCPDPGIPINGMKNSSIYDIGDRIKFECKPKHTLVGTEIRECLENRTWSGAEVKCLGPYDFDNSGKVSEILLTVLAEKKEEQKKDLEKYYKAMNSSMLYGRVAQGRILNLNHPGRLILYFAFDVSGSVGKYNFRKSVKFAKAIVKKIGITDKGSRAGALTFSSKAEVQFFPVTHSSTEDVLSAFDEINYTGGGTSTSNAFALIREVMIPQTEAILSKRGQKSIIFILTDGKANMGGDPQAEAEKLKEAGVEIYCIGITSSTLQESLYRIASKNDLGSSDEFVFILQNYETMSWLIQKITNGTIDYSQCGIGREKLGKKTGRGRIIGGSETEESWPWIAALYFKQEPGLEPELQCGGSIINKNFILTAAHCLFKKNKQQRNETDIIVKLGLTDVKNETYLEQFEIKKIFIHEKYENDIGYDYDIALLQLKRPIEFNSQIRPICMPPMQLNPSSTLYKSGHSAVAIGWGHIGVIQAYQIVPNAKTQNKLKQLILPIQQRETCWESLTKRVNNKPIDKIFTERMFCAGDGKGGNDTCRGDSGGPLMQSQIHEENVYWTQIGIISWGIGCGLPNTYGYYTHIQTLYPWITNTIKSNEVNLKLENEV